jgi:hypothetical protein
MIISGAEHVSSPMGYLCRYSWDITAPSSFMPDHLFCLYLRTLARSTSLEWKNNEEATKSMTRWIFETLGQKGPETRTGRRFEASACYGDQSKRDTLDSVREALVAKRPSKLKGVFRNWND